MKYLYLLLLLGTTANADFPPLDKQLHIATSYAATVTITPVFNKLAGKKYGPLYAGATVMLLGLAKELTDKSGFDKGDIAANTMGTAWGIMFSVVAF